MEQWLEREIVIGFTMKDRSNDPSHHERTLLLRSYISLLASSHRQDNTYHGLCYTSHGAMAGIRNTLCGTSRVVVRLTISDKAYDHRFFTASHKSETLVWVPDKLHIPGFWGFHIIRVMAGVLSGCVFFNMTAKQKQNKIYIYMNLIVE